MTLLDGVPQSGTVDDEGLTFYSFPVPASSTFLGEMTVTATPIKGAVNIFVGATIDPIPDDLNTWSWKKTGSYSGEPLMIRSDDKHYPKQGGKLHVTVLGLSDAVFSIVASVGNHSVFLRDAIPSRGSCKSRQSKYYVVTVDEPHCRLSLSVTPITGDPDLYVSRTDHHPSILHKDEFSATLGLETVEIEDTQIGEYYIGVQTWDPSTFTLAASTTCGFGNTTEDFTFLIDGLPQSGILKAGNVAYYRFDVQPGHFDITFSLFRKFGEPNLYIRNDEDLPSPHHFTWKSIDTGDDLVTIYSTDKYACRKDCSYIVAVAVARGEHAAFILQARTSRALVTLQNNVPIREDLTADSAEYFQITVDSPQDLTVSVTDLGRGDPDLYISCMTEKPNFLNNSWSSATPHGDTISIPFESEESCGLATYYIAVTSYVNTTFTLVASVSNSTHLSDGVPQQGSVTENSIAHFDITVQKGHDLTFSLTSLSGQQSLLVSTTGRPTTKADSFDWFRPYFSAVKEILVPRSDRRSCQNVTCTYYLGVLGSTNGTFTVSVSTNDAEVPLQNGVPVTGQVTEHGWKYFSYKVESENLDIAFVVTPITGDPDIFVSRGSSKPNQTEHDAFSQHFGGDTLDIENAPVGTYFVGIRGSTNSTFTLTAISTDVSGSTSSLDVISLIDGTPQQGFLHKGYVKYYAVEVQGECGLLSIQITKEYGSVKLLAGFGSTFPNATTAQWGGRNGNEEANEIIQIQQPKLGVYTIAVRALTSTAYSLSARTENGFSSLQAGIPLRDKAQAGEYRFFQLPVYTERPFTVSVTPFSGDPDLYIALEPHPCSNFYNWSATVYRGDSIIISPKDPAFCLCTYYIAVYSQWASDFTVLAHFAGTNYLSDGQPQTGIVSSGEFTYYQLRVPDANVDLTVTVLPIAGDPSLYIAVNEQPTLLNKALVRKGTHSKVSVEVRKAQAERLCKLANAQSGNCTFVIGVYGSQQSTYNIVARSSLAAIKLQDGVPSIGNADKGGFSRFFFELEKPGVDMTFVLTPLTGDPDLYVSTKDFPNNTAATYQWSSESLGGDAVSIENATQTTYFISVFANSKNASFTMTAFVVDYKENSTVLLIDGIPQQDVLVEGHMKYYHVVLGASHNDLEVSVSAFVGDPDVYVSFGGELPTRDNSGWKSTKYGKDVLTIDSPVAGQYVIGVYASSTCSYSIIASTTDALETLQDGVSVLKTLKADEFEYFQFVVDRSDMDLSVSVTPLGNGDPDLFISTTAMTPNSTTDNTIRATAYRDDCVTIRAADLTLGTYYIGVTAYLNSTFTLVASFSSETHLQDGLPQGGVVTRRQSKYYQIQFDDLSTDLTVTVTPYVGKAFLCLSTTEKPVVNDADTYQWSKFSDSLLTITVSPGDNHFCQNCTYYLAVYGAANVTRFSVVASSAAAIVTLQDGVPQPSFVEQDQYVFFAFNVENAMCNVDFVLTPLFGDPDLYVSNIIPRPTEHNFTWYSDNYGGDVLNLDYTQEHFSLGTYFIGVSAATNASFSIMAKVTDLNNINHQDSSSVLLEGLPQMGFLNQKGDAAYYTFSPHSHQSVTFTITPRYGDPDLFVTDGSNMSHFEWESHSWGQDSLTIAEGCVANSGGRQGAGSAGGGADSEPKDDGCSYTVKVQAFSHTLFSITATTEDSTTTLQSGVSVFNKLGVDEPAAFYSIKYGGAQGADVGDLLLSVTAFTGKPVLYVSSREVRPNVTTAEYSTTRTLDIKYPQVGDYYISVSCKAACWFSLTASVGAPELVNGEPFTDTVLASKSRYYVVHVNDPTASKDLTVSLDLYNSVQDVTILANNNKRFPSITDATWSTDNLQDTSQRNVLTVAASDSEACFNCTYYIAVVNKAAVELRYAVTAQAEESGVILVSDRPTTAGLSEGGYAFFRAFVSDNTDVNIDLTLFVGDVSVFVKAGGTKRPDAGNWDWKIDSGRLSNHLSIPRSDRKFHSGVWFIGVYGKKDAKFSLTLATHSVLLRDGVPQSGTANSAGTFFFFNVDLPTGADGHALSDIKLSLAGEVKAAQKQAYDVYVDTNITNPGPASASQHTAQWTLRVTGARELVLARADARFCAKCSYYIGVYPVTGEEGSVFNIMASTDGAYEIVMDGSDSHGVSTRPSEWHYYEMYVSDANEFNIQLETCRGDANMYISQKTYKPDFQHHAWSADSDSQIDTITIKDDSIQDSSFYIGVTSDKPSEFNLRTSTSSPVQTLQPGNKGKIEVSTPQASSVVLTFAKANVLSGHYTDNDLQYTVYSAALPSDIAMYSACGLEYANASDPFTAQGKDTLSFTVTGLTPHVKYMFNVGVHTTDQVASALYRAQEGIKTLHPSDISNGGVDVDFLLEIGIPAVLLIAVGVGFLLWKNRRLSQELDIEMHDIPKAALRKAVRGPGFRSKPYSRLLQTDPDDALTLDDTETYFDDDSVGFHAA